MNLEKRMCMRISAFVQWVFCIRPQVFCAKHPTQAGIIPSCGSQYQSSSDTDSVFVVKNRKAEAIFRISVPITVLNRKWQLISFSTAILLPLPKAKFVITAEWC